MNDPTTCPHPRFVAGEHDLCPDCDEHANDIEKDRLRAERDEWRTKALDVEAHPVVVVLRRERDEAQAQVEALTKALERVKRTAEESPLYRSALAVEVREMIAAALKPSAAKEEPDVAAQLGALLQEAGLRPYGRRPSLLDPTKCEHGVRMADVCAKCRDFSAAKEPT